MNEKLSFQNIADALVKKRGVSKKVADTFAKAFFDTIVEALYMGEESIKVKGMGTFKLVSVESRESVNVSNGERIVIPGYKKVSFTPEDAVVEMLNREKGFVEEVAPQVEDFAPKVEVDVVSRVEEVAPQKEEMIPQVEVEASAVENTSDEIDELIQVPEPERVEEPDSVFAGIDMFISTPESVEEVRLKYEEAKAKMEAAVEVAREANAEKVRLEKLLKRLEENELPEKMERGMGQEQDGAEEVLAVDKSDHDAQTTEIQYAARESEQRKGAETEDAAKRQEAFNRVMRDDARKDEPSRKEGNGTRRFWLVSLIFLLLLAIAFFLYKTFRNIEAVEEVPVAERSATPSKSAPKVKKNQQKASAQLPDSVKVDADTLKNAEKLMAKAAEPARPATHVIQRGESLTRISQRYYGTKDSVRAIIRVNAFNDPDNVPVGAVVKLP